MANHSSIEWVTEIEARKGNWKFPDILLNDTTFMEGLNNTIKDSLSGFATDTRRGQTNSGIGKCENRTQSRL